MSRDKFEEWVKEFDIDSVREWQFAHTAWLAGRESMRDEAAKKCANDLVLYDTDHEWNVRCAAAQEINEIEL